MRTQEGQRAGAAGGAPTRAAAQGARDLQGAGAAHGGADAGAHAGLQAAAGHAPQAGARRLQPRKAAGGRMPESHLRTGRFLRR